MKKVRKTRRFQVFLAVMLIGAGTLCAYAGYQSVLRVKNTVSIGNIRISLEEFAKDQSGSLVPYQNPQEILPSQKVSKIPRITCQEKPCYVRAKVNFRIENMAEKEEVPALTEKDFYGIHSGWVRAEDYYYYTRSLKKGEFVELFEGVIFPETVTEKYSGGRLIVEIEADAVQEKNFKPDFQSAHPWQGVEVMQSVKSGNGKQEETISKKNMKITFDGDSAKLISNADDFFKAFGEMMPGDKKTGSVTVKNTTSDTQDISMKMELPQSETKEAQAMLALLTLELKNDDVTVYKGTAEEAVKGGKIYLGRYQKGAKGKLHFTVKAAPEMNNVFALGKSRMDWVFSSEAVDEKNTPVPSNQKNADADGQRNYVPVKTGDQTKGLWYLLLMGGTVFAALCIQFKAKRRDA